jgi:hypothetical protein
VYSLLFVPSNVKVAHNQIDADISLLLEDGRMTELSYRNTAEPAHEQDDDGHGEPHGHDNPWYHNAPNLPIESSPTSEELRQTRIGKGAIRQYVSHLGSRSVLVVLVLLFLKVASDIGRSKVFSLHLCRISDGVTALWLRNYASPDNGASSPKTFISVYAAMVAANLALICVAIS